MTFTQSVSQPRHLSSKELRSLRLAREALRARHLADLKEVITKKGEFGSTPAVTSTTQLAVVAVFRALSLSGKLDRKAIAVSPVSPHALAAVVKALAAPGAFVAGLQNFEALLERGGLSVIPVKVTHAFLLRTSLAAAAAPAHPSTEPLLRWLVAAVRCADRAASLGSFDAASEVNGSSKAGELADSTEAMDELAETSVDTQLKSESLTLDNSFSDVEENRGLGDHQDTFVSTDGAVPRVDCGVTSSFHPNLVGLRTEENCRMRNESASAASSSGDASSSCRNADVFGAAVSTEPPRESAAAIEFKSRVSSNRCVGAEVMECTVDAAVSHGHLDNLKNVMLAGHANDGLQVEDEFPMNVADGNHEAALDPVAADDKVKQGVGDDNVAVAKRKRFDGGEAMEHVWLDHHQLENEVDIAPAHEVCQMEDGLATKVDDESDFAKTDFDAIATGVERDDDVTEEHMLSGAEGGSSDCPLEDIEHINSDALSSCVEEIHQVIVEFISKSDDGEDLRDADEDDDSMGTDAGGDVVNAYRREDSLGCENFFGCNIALEEQSSGKEPGVECDVTSYFADKVSPDERGGACQTQSGSAFDLRDSCDLASTPRDDEIYGAFAAAKQSHMSVGDNGAVAMHEELNGFEALRHGCLDEVENERVAAPAREAPERKVEFSLELDGDGICANADFDALTTGVQRDHLGEVSMWLVAEEECCEGPLGEVVKLNSDTLCSCVGEIHQITAEFDLKSTCEGKLCEVANDDDSMGIDARGDIANAGKIENSCGSGHMLVCNTAFVRQNDCSKPGVECDVTSNFAEQIFADNAEGGCCAQNESTFGVTESCGFSSAPRDDDDRSVDLIGTEHFFASVADRREAHEMEEKFSDPFAKQRDFGTTDFDAVVYDGKRHDEVVGVGRSSGPEGPIEDIVQLSSDATRSIPEGPDQRIADLILKCGGCVDELPDDNEDYPRNFDGEGGVVISDNSEDSFAHEALLGCNVALVERDGSALAVTSKACEARARGKQSNVVVGLPVAAGNWAVQSQDTYASNDCKEPSVECHVGSPRAGKFNAGDSDGGCRTKSESVSVVHEACGLASASREADAAFVVVAREKISASGAAMQSHMSVGGDDVAVAEHTDSDGFGAGEHRCPDQMENEEETATAHEACEMGDEFAPRVDDKCDVAHADLDAIVANLERDDDFSEFRVGPLEDIRQPRSDTTSTCVEETGQTVRKLISKFDKLEVLLVADKKEYSNQVDVAGDLVHASIPDDLVQCEDSLGSEHLCGCDIAYLGQNDSSQALASGSREASVTGRQPCVFVGPSMLKPQLCRAAPVATALLVANTLFIISLLCVDALLRQGVLR